MNIGVYCGSFNPWHIGHQSVLYQAENVFDKVIVARGINDTKKDIELEPLPKHITDRFQCEEYSGLLTDYLNKMKDYFPPVLIRGLRNANDLLEEQNLRQWLNLDGFDVVYFMANQKYAHVSSSSIRMLRDKYPELVKDYIFKNEKS